jgi:hypothetical protein
VLDIVGGCDSIVSGDLNPFPFEGIITDGKAAITLIGMVKNRNATVTSVAKKIFISSELPFNRLSLYVMDDSDLISV